jgi:hypothetical protein
MLTRAALLIEALDLLDQLRGAVFEVAKRRKVETSALALLPACALAALATALRERVALGHAK